MRLKNLLVYLFIPVALASCKKDVSVDNSGSDNNNQPDPVVPVTPKPYIITEDFENGSKDGYAAGNITLITGSWNFNDALIGNLTADLKNGAKSVRLRNGSLGMNFDINGLTMLYIKHGKYGSDANSTWQLLMSTDGGSTYTQLGNTINETSATLVTDSFKVTTTGKIRFQIKNTTGNNIRINIDDITFKGTGDPGITIGGSDNTPDDPAPGNATTPRGVNVGTDAPPASGDNSNILLGMPTNAANVSTTDFLIDAGYYMESYNGTRGTPNWVSWHLDGSNTTQAAGRQDNFAGYIGLPTGVYQVQSNSYSGSGFDRGHNCPSADRTSSTNANSSTFLMTNMIPQAPNNNQHTWANLENYLRAQVTAGKEVYIIMGNYGTGGIGSNSTATIKNIDNSHVTVPSNVWKVALIMPAGNSDLIRAGDVGSVRVIAVNTPNVNSINSDWTKYITTVRAIETANGNGLNIFSNLPQSVQDALETKTDAGI